jgi:hypothetical protein
MFLEYVFHQPVNLTNTYSGSLWIKPTDTLDSNFIGLTTTCFGQPFCPSSGVLSRTSALVHFMQFWWPFLLGAVELCSILLLVANGHQNCIKCTHADIRLRTPDDGQKGFQCVCWFIHKEFVTMHGHTILKYIFWVWILAWRLIVIVTIWMQYFVIVTQHFRPLCHLQHRMWTWELFCRQHLLGDKPQCYLQTYKLLHSSVLSIISGCNENKYTVGGWEQKCFGWFAGCGITLYLLPNTEYIKNEWTLHILSFLQWN